MKKEKKQKAIKANGDEEAYVLTDAEHARLKEALFHAESAVRLIKEGCLDRGAANQDFMDVANCLDLVNDQLKIMGPLLLK